MLAKTKTAILASFLAVVGAVLPGFAFADGTGTSIELPQAEVLALVADAQTFILAIGAGVLLLIFVIKALRWARRAG